MKDAGSGFDEPEQADIPKYRSLDPRVLTQLQGYFSEETNTLSAAIEKYKADRQGKQRKRDEIAGISNPLKQWWERAKEGDLLTDYETDLIANAERRRQELNRLKLQLNPGRDGRSRIDTVEAFLEIRIKNGLMASGLPGEDSYSRRFHRAALDNAREAAIMFGLLEPEKAQVYMNKIESQARIVSFLDGPEIVG